MGKLNHIVLGITLISSAFAQSAANFDAVSTPEEPTTEATPAAAPPAAALGVEVATAIASRFVSKEELEPYVGALVSVFQSRSREKDPFGQYQDPDATPVVKVVSSRIARRAPVKAVPLSEIVSRLQITTIMPGDNSFLIGTRRIALGQELPIVWRGNQLRVQVTGVDSKAIEFMNVETNETGVRTMDILPVGMSLGTGASEIMAPGMVPDRPDAPINLDAGE